MPRLGLFEHVDCVNGDHVLAWVELVGAQDSVVVSLAVVGSKKDVGLDGVFCDKLVKFL